MSGGRKISKFVVVSEEKNGLWLGGRHNNEGHVVLLFYRLRIKSGLCVGAGFLVVYSLFVVAGSMVSLLRSQDSIHTEPSARRASVGANVLAKVLRTCRNRSLRQLLQRSVHHLNPCGTEFIREAGDAVYL